MKVLISDTSVLLNLLAADCLGSVASATGWQFAICTAVQTETKKLRDAVTGELVVVDVGCLIETGVLQLLEMTDVNEQARYVDLAAIVDDGEAMSIAMAAERGYDLAIDDMQAGNHARRAFPALKLWTTPEILKTWSESSGVTRGHLIKAITAIENRARYIPPRSHLLFHWWISARD